MGPLRSCCYVPCFVFVFNLSRGHLLVIVIDASFEQVWNNGTTPRAVMILDVWHPALTSEGRDEIRRLAGQMRQAEH